MDGLCIGLTGKTGEFILVMARFVVLDIYFMEFIYKKQLTKHLKTDTIKIVLDL